MTANQIARASAEYANAHNKATEEIASETNAINAAHYERMDAINKSLADLEKDKLELDRWYKDSKMRLDKDIAYRGFDIESERIHLENEYRTKMANVEALNVEYTNQRNQETERHNRELETLEWSSNALKDKSIEYENRIKRLELQYQKEYWDNSMLASWANINNTAQKISNEQWIAQQQLNLERRKFNFGLETWETNRQKLESEIFRNRVTPILDAALGVLRTGASLVPTFVK